MKVFVAGATGFIGNAACRALVGAGHEVTGLARSAEKGARLAGQGIRPVIGRLEDPASFAREAGRPEAVIHLAAPPFPERETIEATERNGALLRAWTGSLTRWALESSVRIFVFGGTFRVLADDTKEPARRISDDGPVGYERLLQPAQAELEIAARRDALPLMVLVPGWVYGPGQWFAGLVDEIPTGRTSHLVGGGEARIGYVELDDAGEAFRLAVERDRPPGFYDIVDDDPCSVREFVETTARAIGAPMPRGLDPAEASARHGEVFVEALTISSRLDNSGARAALGWRPRHATTRDGIPATVARIRGRS